MIDAAAVARYGLAGRPEPCCMTLESAGWPRLLSDVTNHNLTGMLVAMVVDGAAELSEGQEDSLVEAHRAAIARDLLVERTVLWAAGCLEGAGLDLRVLKGAAVAHLDYPDPALRSFADADILVRPEEWEAATEALEEAGARRDSREPRRGWDRRFAKCATFRTTEGFEVDLHRTFVFGPLGFSIGLRDLWSSSEPFELGGRKLKALEPEARWLHACYTAAVDSPPRLVTLRDVAQLAGDDRLDRTRLDQLVSGWQAAGVVRRAVDLTGEVLGVGVPEPVRAWAQELAVTRREADTLRAYTDPGDRYVRLAVAAIRAVPGWGAKAAYAAGLLWPEAGYVDYRYTGQLQRWRALGTRVRQAVLAGRQRRERVKGSRG